jgi:dTDP-4-amino-4,6-dideoxygalactose transaminase
MRDNFLPFSPPLIGEEEIAEVVDTLRSDWITTGPKVRRFEQEFAQEIGAEAALAVSSCTAAMHLALTTLGVGRGDAVIASPMTFCSGVHVIEQVGARPVLVDIEPDTLNLDTAKVAEQVEKMRHGSEDNSRVKAILPVHLYGHPCEIDQLLDVAREHKLALVEDAAHSLPAKYKGRTVGSRPTSQVPVLTCFSFYATKNLTTAEGGMLTADPDTIERARVWSLHGMSRDAWNRYGSEGSWFYEVSCPGFKYNMTDIQAAIGLQQLRKLPQLYARRQLIAQRYNHAFSNFEELQLPTERAGVEHAWHLYVLRLNLQQIGISRNQFIEKLRKRNIASSVHFIPVHLHRYYRDKYSYSPESFPIAYREYRRMISLPLYPQMCDQDVDDVIEAVYDTVKKERAKTRTEPKVHSVAESSALR